MQNKKFIIIGIIAAVIVLILVFVWLSLGPADKNQFQVSFNIHNGAVTSTLVENKHTKALGATEIGNYVLTSFNSPRDILWVSCIEGFTLRDASSETNSTTVHDPTLGVGVEILPDKDSQLTILCVKE